MLKLSRQNIKNNDPEFIKRNPFGWNIYNRNFSPEAILTESNILWLHTKLPAYKYGTYLIKDVNYIQIDPKTGVDIPRPSILVHYADPDMALISNTKLFFAVSNCK